MIVCHSEHLEYPYSLGHTNKELIATSGFFWFAFLYLFWTEHVFDSVLENNTA